MAYEAKILADSVTERGSRLVTFQVTFPRFILAEYNTHCMLARSSASSRAIPVEKRLLGLEKDPFMPEVFGKNKSGMQSAEDLDGEQLRAAKFQWLHAADEAVSRAAKLARLGVHKQLANRVIEPYLWHTVITTATDWSNFFHLRNSKNAQPEMMKIAGMMQELYHLHEPRLLKPGEWHLPLVHGFDEDMIEAENHTFKPLLSSARCARVSYLTHDGIRDLVKDLQLYSSLLENGHMAPLEHPARPMTDKEYELFKQRLVTLRMEDGSFRTWRVSLTDRQIAALGWTIINSREVAYCGKLNGWISHRAEIPGEADITAYRMGMEI